MRWLLGILALCFFVGLENNAHPTFRTYLDFTDHFSHSNSLLLFFHSGLKIFGSPTQELCAHATSIVAGTFAQQNGVNPDDLCQIEPDGRLFVINWEQRPRTYPLGTMLLFAPVAFGLTQGLSFVAANQLAVLWMFLLATICIGFLCWRCEHLHSRAHARSVKILLFMFSWIVLFLAVSGLPDLVSVAFLAVSILEGLNTPPRWGRAWMWACLAAFTHFRAFWYGPWFLWLLWQMWRHDRATFKTATFCLSTAILLFSVYTFFLGLPAIQQMPINNPLFMLALDTPWLLLTACGAVAAWLLWQREWLLLCLVMSSLAFAVLVHEVRFWHVAFWFPLLWMTIGTKRPAVNMAAIVALIFLLDQFVYGSQIFLGFPLRTMFAGIAY